MLINSHTAGSSYPACTGNYRIVSIKGNEVKVMQSTGGRTKIVDISDGKCILLADNVTLKIVNYQTFGRKTLLRLNPDHMPYLGWMLSTSINTIFSVISDVHT